MKLSLNRFNQNINEIDEINLTCAIVFKGNVRLFDFLIKFIKENGSLIYKKGVSPDKKLYITQKKTVENDLEEGQ